MTQLPLFPLTREPEKKPDPKIVYSFRRLRYVEVVAHL